MESETRAEGSLWEDEWITDTNVTLKENEILEALDCEIDVPCPLQWGLLWFSAPTNLNHKFVNNGTKVEKFREIVNLAIELTCNCADSDGGLVQCHDQDWDLKEEMREWGY